jgi:hypothetical protein
VRDNPGLDAFDLATVYIHFAAGDTRYPSGSACTLKNIDDSGCVAANRKLSITLLGDRLHNLLEADFWPGIIFR